MALHSLLKNKQTDSVAWPYFWTPCTSFYASGPCIKHAPSPKQNFHSPKSEACFRMAHFSERHATYAVYCYFWTHFPQTDFSVNYICPIAENRFGNHKFCKQQTLITSNYPLSIFFKKLKSTYCEKKKVNQNPHSNFNLPLLS